MWAWECASVYVVTASEEDGRVHRRSRAFVCVCVRVYVYVYERQCACRCLGTRAPGTRARACVRV